MEPCKVLVTRRLPDLGMKMIQKECQIDLWDENYPLPHENLQKMVIGVDGIVCVLSDSIDSSIIDLAGPQLKVISIMAVGCNNTDVEEATSRNIFIGNTLSNLFNSCSTSSR